MFYNPAGLGTNYGQASTAAQNPGMVFPGDPGYTDAYRPGGPIPGSAPRPPGEGGFFSNLFTDIGAGAQEGTSNWIENLLAGLTGTGGNPGAGHTPQTGIGRVPGGLPRYAQGTNYVPQTGPALLHQGEAVVPANQNPANPNARAYPPGITRVAPGQGSPYRPTPAPPPAPAPPQGPVTPPPSPTPGDPGSWQTFGATSTPQAPAAPAAPTAPAPPPVYPMSYTEWAAANPDTVQRLYIPSMAYQAYEQAMQAMTGNTAPRPTQAPTAAPTPTTAPPPTPTATPTPNVAAPPVAAPAPGAPPSTAANDLMAQFQNMPPELRQIFDQNQNVVQELLGMQGPLTSGVQQQILSGVRDNRDAGLQTSLRQMQEELAGRGMGTGNLADYMQFQGMMGRDADMANAERQLGTDSATANFTGRLQALDAAQQNFGTLGGLINDQSRLGLDAYLGQGGLDVSNRGLDIQQLLGQGDIDLRRELGLGGLDLQRELGLGGLDLQGQQLDLQRLLGQGSLDLQGRQLDQSAQDALRQFQLAQAMQTYNMGMGNNQFNLAALLGFGGLLGDMSGQAQQFDTDALNALIASYFGGNTNAGTNVNVNT